MPDTLFLLRLEHANQSSMLGLIDEQLTAADAGEPLDGELLGLVAEYFSDFPEQCHHPKEDLVYRRLAERDPASCDGIRDLVADHRQLQQLTKDFASAVHRLNDQPVAAQPAAQAAMQNFSRHLRQHLQDEEEHFFRLAEERLSPADWDSLDFTVFDRDDPLFEHAAEKRFQALRKRVDALASRSKTVHSLHAACSDLRQLASVEDFNGLMKSTGRQFRLARFAEGGYGLENAGELLFQLPECPPQTASWCAYAFVSGRSPSP
jgi:hemerythrin-like domain-containing protein